MKFPPAMRDELLAQDPVRPDVREQLQKEIQTMLIRELSLPRRAAMIVIAIFDVIAAIVCGSLVVTEQGLPPLARVGLGVGTLFAVAWVAWLVRLLRRGEMNLREDGRWMARMVWGFTLLMVIFMVIAGATMADRSKGLLMIMQSFLFLISAAVYWLNHRIEDSELNITERLLRMELQLAELSQSRSPAS